MPGSAALAKARSSRAIEVAIPQPSNSAKVKYAISTSPEAGGALKPQLPTTHSPVSARYTSQGETNPTLSYSKAVAAHTSFTSSFSCKLDSLGAPERPIGRSRSCCIVVVCLTMSDCEPQLPHTAAVVVYCRPPRAATRRYVPCPSYDTTIWSGARAARNAAPGAV